MSSICTFSFNWRSIITSCTFTKRVKSFTVWISCYAVSLIFAVSLITLTTGISICLKCFAIFWSIYTLSTWCSSYCVSGFALKAWTVWKEDASTIWICLKTTSILDYVVTLIALKTCGLWGRNFTIRYIAIDKH